MVDSADHIKLDLLCANNDNAVVEMIPNNIFAYFKKRGLFNNIFEKRGGIIDAKVRRISIRKLSKNK